MRLTVLASGSSGNGYLLEARHSALLLECGVKPEAMMRRISMPVSRIAGALITHEHGDHAGYAQRYASLGIPVFASAGTLAAIRLSGTTRPLRAMEVAYVDDWKIMPFDVRHDAAEPLGFVIEHPEAGRILFLTDTAYCPYDFRMLHLDHIMVEANFDDQILDGNVANGRIDAARAARTRGKHMSIRGACELICADMTAELKTVVLIHLSTSNGNAKEFSRMASQTALFARIHVAKAGLSVELNKNEI